MLKYLKWKKKTRPELFIILVIENLIYTALIIVGILFATGVIPCADVGLSFGITVIVFNFIMMFFSDMFEFKKDYVEYRRDKEQW